MVRKLFTDYTIEDYKYLTKFGYKEHPDLSHGDIPTSIVDYLSKQYYFRAFLLRLFDIDNTIGTESPRPPQS